MKYIDWQDLFPVSGYGENFGINKIKLKKRGQEC